MMDFINKIVVVVCALLFFIQGNSCTALSTQCSMLIFELQYCTNFVTDSSNNWKQLLTCKDSVEKILVRCRDDYALKIIEHQSKAYDATAQLFSSGTFSSDLVSDANCLEMVDRVLDNWVYLTSGFLTDKGCGYYKQIVLMKAMSVEVPKCFPMITKYVNRLYTLTSCVNVNVENPTKTEISHRSALLANFDNCLNLYKPNLKCNNSDEKSNRLQCVQNVTLTAVNNPSIKHLQENMIDVIVESDRLFCENENLRKEFESDVDECFTYGNKVTKFFLDQVNAFFTDEGCEALEYIDHFTTTSFGGICRDRMLQEYWTEMKKRLSCGEKIIEPAESSDEKSKSQLSYGMKLSATSRFLIATIVLAVLFAI